MDGGAFDEAVQEGQKPFQKEGGEAEAAKPEETATSGDKGAENAQANASEGEKTPSDDAPQNVSPRAQDRYRELARRNRELEEKLTGLERSFDERLKATTTKGEKPTAEEKYLQELAEYMWNYTQSKMTASQKEEAEAQRKMDEQIKGELRELSLEHEGFDPQKALEYSFKYGTPTLKQGYEIYLEAQKAREEAKKEVAKAEPRKRAAGAIAGAVGGGGKRSVQPEDLRGKSFAEIRDEIAEEFGG